MSRTKRRKTVPNGGQGRCYWDSWNFSTWSYHPITGTWGRIPIDKESEPKKWKQAVWKAHRESAHCCERSPGRLYRQYREEEHRSLSKEQLHKFRMIPDYEVIIPDNPQNCWWDWS